MCKTAKESDGVRQRRPHSARFQNNSEITGWKSPPETNQLKPVPKQLSGRSIFRRVRESSTNFIEALRVLMVFAI